MPHARARVQARVIVAGESSRHYGSVAFSSNIPTQLVPAELQCLPKLGGYFYRRNVSSCLNHLKVASAYVGPLGKLLLCEVRQVSETVDVLAKFNAVGFRHPFRMQRRMVAESEACFALELTSCAYRGKPSQRAFKICIVYLLP